MDVVLVETARPDEWRLTDLLGRSLGCVSEVTPRRWRVYPSGAGVEILRGISQLEFASIDAAAAEIEKRIRGACRFNNVGWGGRTVFDPIKASCSLIGWCVAPEDRRRRRIQQRIRLRLSEAGKVRQQNASPRRHSLRLDTGSCPINSVRKTGQRKPQSLQDHTS
jgi:hypothetical protein